MTRIKYLETKIKVGQPYQAPNWERPVTVAEILSVEFVIEDSEIEGVQVIFRDHTGHDWLVMPEWSDATQGYSLEV